MAGLLGHAVLGLTGLLVCAMPALVLRSAGSSMAALAVLAGGVFVMGFVAPAFLATPRPGDGVEVSRRVAPELHALVTLIRRRLGAPPIDAILLNTDFDVRIVCGARSLLSGRTRRYLVIGFPLTHAVSAAEFRALVARELGLISRQQNPLTAHIAARRAAWLRCSAATSGSRRWMASALHRLYAWFIPAYDRLTLPFARDHQLAADRLASTISSSRILASALLRRRLSEFFVKERVFRDVRAQIGKFGVPMNGLHRRFERALRGAFDDPRFDSWLIAAIQGRDRRDEDETALRDRLDSLGFGIGNRAAFGTLLELAFSRRGTVECAADRYLGEACRDVTMSLEMSWASRIAEVVPAGS